MQLSPSHFKALPYEEPILADLSWRGESWRRALAETECLPIEWSALLASFRKMWRADPGQSVRFAAALAVAQGHSCQLVFDVLVALGAAPEHVRSTLRPLTLLEARRSVMR